jgi:hypothetical protein
MKYFASLFPLGMLAALAPSPFARAESAPPAKKKVDLRPVKKKSAAAQEFLPVTDPARREVAPPRYRKDEEARFRMIQKNQENGAGTHQGTHSIPNGNEATP